VSVLPVVITGTHRVWEHPYRPNVTTGVEVGVEVLAPIPPEHIAEAATGLERDMKRRALSSRIEPRRFEPDRDGWWDDYPYEIDPSFPELADRVAYHRSLIARGS
jgi:1-acyl-sn-glycerol-3-phosphate acyltransferase